MTAPYLLRNICLSHRRHSLQLSDIAVLDSFVVLVVVSYKLLVHYYFANRVRSDHLYNLSGKVKL